MVKTTIKINFSCIDEKNKLCHKWYSTIYFFDIDPVRLIAKLFFLDNMCRYPSITLCVWKPVVIIELLSPRWIGFFSTYSRHAVTGSRFGFSEVQKSVCDCSIGIREKFYQILRIFKAFTQKKPCAVMSKIFKTEICNSSILF